ncbi:FAD-dependent oxidoreductase [Mycoplasmoides genitalium]|uniref:FAD-dependent oxidoreductase n=1 Tax=Mycoplasmoides genitalium TaxID=2097 RepID=UPI002FCE0BC5
MKKVIVIGINHAGTSFIRTLLSKSKDFKVNAYDRNTNISFLGCGIALAVSGVVKNTDDLFYSNPKELKQMGANIFMSHDVTNIDLIKKQVKVRDLTSNKEFTDQFDQLVIASGAWPICMNVENKVTHKPLEFNYTDKYCGNVKNLISCKLYQHALTLIDSFRKDKTIKSVAIVGSGYIGLELAEAAWLCKKQVTVIDLLDKPAGNNFDHEFTDELKKVMQKDGLKLMMGCSVKGFVVDSTNNVVKGVETDKGIVNADLVIQSIGFRPSTKFVPKDQNFEFIHNGSIKVNEFLQALNHKDVYVIGGCAAIYNAASEQYENIDLATNAVKSGLVAAMHIIGSNQVKLQSIVGTNALHIFGLNLAACGLTEQRAKKLGFDVGISVVDDNDRPEFMGSYDKVRFKLVYDKKTLRILGAQLLSWNTNHSEIIFYIALAIQKQMLLTELGLVDVYFLPHYNKPFNFVLATVLQALGFSYYIPKK